MRVLFTGASSNLGRAVLERLLASTDWQLFCVRNRGKVDIEDPRVSIVDVDLGAAFAYGVLPEEIDLVVHFAAVTHARRAERYWQINRDGTVRLADAVQKRGCRRFVYISTRCATPGSGDYGESKLAAEELLKAGDWQSLMIIRPSEVYSGVGNEGIDKFIGLARNHHFVPMLFGDSRIRFSPLFIDDFVSLTVSAVIELKDGIAILEMCGPHELSGVDVASRLTRAFRAVPIPIWWPAMRVALGAARLMGLHPVRPDQIRRLVCDKTCDTSKDESLEFFYP